MVKQLAGWLAGERVHRAIRLTARGIGQAPHRKDYSLPEALVQVFGNRAGPGGQRDLERGRLAKLVTRIRPLQQRAGLLVTQPGEDHPELIPDRHGQDATRPSLTRLPAACYWPLQVATDPSPGSRAGSSWSPRRRPSSTSDPAPRTAASANPVSGSSITRTPRHYAGVLAYASRGIGRTLLSAAYDALCGRRSAGVPVRPRAERTGAGVLPERGVSP
jgi:hypothetical protein